MAIFGRYSSGGAAEYLVVGLGNPGREYENTRHNAGFMAVDHLAARAGIPVQRIRFKSLCGTGQIAGRQVLLLKPTTYMNLSGQAVQEAMAFYKIPPERTLILFDDISLDVGRIRIRRKGSDGGHNGMKNIIYLSGSDAFPRVKIGVGQKPHPDYDLAKWVLSRFTAGEQKLLREEMDRIADAAELVLAGRIDEAMNRYNG